MRRLAAAALLLSLSACPSGVKPTGLPACRPAGLLNVGDRLPGCRLRRFDGSVLDLTSLAGKPAVLNFWASWCNECIKEMPAIATVARQIGSAATIVGFNTLGVRGESESSARQFAKARGADYPLAFDPNGLLYSHFSQGGAQRPLLPTSIFVSGDGTIAFRRFGEYTVQALRADIKTYLHV